MFLLVAYDIASDRRRDDVSQLLASGGFRVQFSVFEHPVVSAAQREDLIVRLTSLIDPIEDQIRIYTLSERDGEPERTIIGDREIEEPRGFWLL